VIICGRGQRRACYNPAISAFSHSSSRPHENYNLAFLGFGNVGRALVQLLESKRGELAEHYGVTFTFTGVATRRLGWHANPAGFAALT